MSDPSDFGFARLVPGFDFLQNLAKGATQGMAQMPGLSSWVAPTLDVEEIDKRIGELKAVQFWLDQNGKALAATIQALEVQKMTLATLQGMNVSMGEMAEALRAKPGPQPARAAPASAGDKPATAVDPLQWWGALTQQFQEIASSALKDVAQQAAGEGARGMAAGREAMQGASGTAAQAVSSIPKTARTPTKRPTRTARKAATAGKGAAGKPAPRKRAAPAP